MVLSGPQADTRRENPKISPSQTMLRWLNLLETIEKHPINMLSSLEFGIKRRLEINDAGKKGEKEQKRLGDYR
jgi:hypothetical protein